MLLRNLRLVNSDIITDILIKDGKIDTVGNFFGSDEGLQTIDFDEAIAFPGLINSHDHLDFNLFPQLGNKLYGNYVEWSTDIHKTNKEVISRVLKIPKQLRTKWGVYKNLLNGVTTVVNHGGRLETDSDLITIIQENCDLHSVQLEQYWKYKLNKPFPGVQPYVIHVGEGVDYMSRREIDKLTRWNLFKRDIVGVHGIAMNERQAAYFMGLVWCPASNYFLIGETAPINRLATLTDVVFGTDSTLSAGWNMWEHLRLARNEGMVSDKELFNMVTATPAELWGLAGCGRLEEACDADVVIARRKNGMSGYNAYYAIDPEDILMVMHKGAIKLFDEELFGRWNNRHNLTGNFSRIMINGSIKYVFGNLPDLAEQVKNYYPDVNFPFESISL